MASFRVTAPKRKGDDKKDQIKVQLAKIRMESDQYKLGRERIIEDLKTRHNRLKSLGTSDPDIADDRQIQVYKESLKCTESHIFLLDGKIRGIEKLLGSV